MLHDGRKICRILRRFPKRTQAGKMRWHMMGSLTTMLRTTARWCTLPCLACPSESRIGLCKQSDNTRANRGWRLFSLSRLPSFFTRSLVSTEVACDGFYARILAHSNGRMGLRHHQCFVCAGGMAAAGVSLAIGWWSTGRLDGCIVSCDVNAGLLRNGGCKSGTGGCGGRKKGGGRRR